MLRQVNNSWTTVPKGRDYVEMQGRLRVGTVTVQHKGNIRFHIWNVRVLEEHRRKGYGTRMMLNILRKYRGRKLSLYVYKSNNAAIGLYKKVGFKVVEGIEASTGMVIYPDMLVMST